jgi:hypothetical protein
MEMASRSSATAEWPRSGRAAAAKEADVKARRVIGKVGMTVL